MGRHLPRSIRMERERKRLEQVAQERGYENSAVMLQKMYEVDCIPIEQIAHELFTPLWSLRKRFDELHIKVRNRGGRNNVLIEVTEDLYNEACRIGLSGVAERLGVDTLTLDIRLTEWVKQQQRGDTGWDIE